MELSEREMQDADTILERVPFSMVTDAYRRLQGGDNRVKRKVLVGEVLDGVFEEVGRIAGVEKKKRGGGEFGVPPSMRIPAEMSFAILRLLCPQMDRSRGSYNMKEKLLARLYSDALNLTADNEDALALKNYTNPAFQTSQRGIPDGSTPLAGDFVAVLSRVLICRLGSGRQAQPFSVQEIHRILDSLARIDISYLERLDIFQSLVTRATAEENGWFARLVLKDMKMGLGERPLLDWFHPDAYTLFSSTRDLHRVCVEASRSTFAMADKWAFVHVFSPAKLQNSYSCPADIEDVIKAMGSEEGFWIERKYDGERLQLHKQGNKIECFTRAGFNSDDLWLFFLESELLRILKDHHEIVLDGEVLVWDREAEKYLTPADGRKRIQEIKSKGDMKEVHVQFIVFDIIFWQKEGTPSRLSPDLMDGPGIIKLRFSDRRAILDTIVPSDGDIVTSAPGYLASKPGDIMAALDQFVSEGYEGVMIKNTKKPYVLGSRELSISVKLKPDFLEGGLSDIDAIILGCQFGSGEVYS